jgi:eukaryotic-like serine/threonine-protein kinase
LGAEYNTLGEPKRASEYYAKAYELRDHASEREKLAITADYYEGVTGEVEKAARAYQEWIESYPRDKVAHINLGSLYMGGGQFAKAAEEYREALQLAPDNVGPYEGFAISLLALQRFDEARQTVQQAQGRKLDDFPAHNVLYSVAFVISDSAGMAEQQQWFAGKPEYENFGLVLASDTEAYVGHLGKARELTKRAVDSAIRADSKEGGAISQAVAAKREAAFGNAAQAKQAAVEALRLAPTSQSVEAEAALALTVAGDAARAAFLAQDLSKHYPLESLWLPAIRPSSLGLPASIQHTFAVRRISQPDRAPLPLPSSRRFSTTAASSGTAGRERWCVWAWRGRMRCRQKPLRERTPTSLAVAPSPLTKISSRSGRTPTLTSPS